MTYVGLSFIGLSSIVFKIFCPKEISAYKDGREFIDSAVATSYPDEMRRCLSDISTPFWYESSISGIEDCRKLTLVETNSTQAAKIHGTSGNPLPRTEWLDKNLNSINSILDTSYKIKNFANLFIRTILLLGFSTGFILTLIPSLQTFTKVLIEVIAYLYMGSP